MRKRPRARLPYEVRESRRANVGSSLRLHYLTRPQLNVALRM